ncbi:MAG: hypothetical protein AAF927_04055 [Bacteroidota bacterium]
MNYNHISRLFTLLIMVALTLVACKDPNTMEEEEEEQTNNNPYGITFEEIADFPVGESTTVNGNIDDGIVLPDLDWADLSNVACFPGTRFIEFQGKQEFYTVNIPQGSELIVTVTPTGSKERINLYGYIDFNGNNLPPLTSVLSCEAGYELYVGNPDLTQPGEPQSISFAQAVNKGFTCFVAVSGAKDVEAGEYSLEFRLEPY